MTGAAILAVLLTLTVPIALGPLWADLRAELHDHAARRPRRTQ